MCTRYSLSASDYSEDQQLSHVVLGLSSVCYAAFRAEFPLGDDTDPEYTTAAIQWLESTSLFQFDSEDASVRWEDGEPIAVLVCGIDHDDD